MKIEKHNLTAEEFKSIISSVPYSTLMHSDKTKTKTYDILVQREHDDLNELICITQSHSWWSGEPEYTANKSHEYIMNLISTGIVVRDLLESRINFLDNKIKQACKEVCDSRNTRFVKANDMDVLNAADCVSTSEILDMIYDSKTEELITEKEFDFIYKCSVIENNERNTKNASRYSGCHLMPYRDLWRTDVQ